MLTVPLYRLLPVPVAAPPMDVAAAMAPLLTVAGGAAPPGKSVLKSL